MRATLSQAYCKGMFVRQLRRGGVLLCVVALCVVAVAPGGLVAAQTTPEADFSDWDLPLPAGQWVITRGPCGSGGEFSHQCGYYEDQCALDLISPAGSMEHVPVLAPQDGQVFFTGTRADSGLALLLQHDDGRVSALMHLARVVVTPDQRVRKGQVIAYAGNTGSSGRAHLHFHVQPNSVERKCVPLVGLDEINVFRASASSSNLAWSALTLVDPPPTLPSWLSLSATDSTTVPSRIVLPPLGRANLPLAISRDALASANIYFAGRQLLPMANTATYSLFTVALSAPVVAGEYQYHVQLRPTGASASIQTILLRLAVQPAADTSAARDIVLISPTFVSPSNYAELKVPPRLCWSEPAMAGTPPLRFRAMVVGSMAADSGWISSACWQTSGLVPGTYYWKVFVRDGNGFMNRTNQRPFVFKIE